MRKLIRNVMDYSNVCFALLGIGFFNVAIFDPGHWNYLIFYAAFLGVNIYCCYVSIKIKDYSVDAVIAGLNRNVTEVSADPYGCSHAERKLRRYIQWGDVAELAFGKYFGRLFIECLLLCFFITAGTAQMCSTRLMGSLAFIGITNTSRNIKNFEELEVANTNLLYIGMLCGFLVSVAFLRFRYIGITSLFGFIIIFSESLKIANSTMIFTTLPNDTKFPVTTQKFSQLFIFQNCGPQIAGMILTIHNNMGDNETSFWSTICVGSILTIFVVVLIGSSIVMLPFSKPKRFPFSTIIQMNSSLTIKVFDLVAYIFFFFLLNYPLFDITERWMSFCYCHKDAHHGQTEIREEENEPFMAENRSQSVFSRLYRNENSVLRVNQIIANVRVKIPVVSRVGLRIAIILTEWLIGYMIWTSRIGSWVFALFQLLSTLFTGFVAPFLLHLKLFWKNLPTVRKVAEIAIIIGAFVWNVVHSTMYLHLRPEFD